jgi:hypothetical protein
MSARSLAFGIVALGLLAGHNGTSYAEPIAVDSWQMKRLFKPTQADLKSEARGRVMIYDGLTDKTVERALREQFHRVDAMMFTRTVVTDAGGAPRRDRDSGALLHEDDGCD